MNFEFRPSWNCVSVRTRKITSRLIVLFADHTLFAQQVAQVGGDLFATGVKGENETETAVSV